MKSKTLLSAFIAIFIATIFIACDDDLNSVGDSIQPDGDNVEMGTDSFNITARTIALDRIYAKTASGLLGNYNDPLLGAIKSDYLFEFYCPDSLTSKDNPFWKAFAIDSVKLNIVIQHRAYTGDSTATMGVAAYEVNNYLDKNYYSDIKPSDYCDLSKPLLKSAYTVSSSPIVDSTRSFSFNMDTTYMGHRFLNEFRRDGSKTFTSSNNLREFIKGVYLTTNFGSGNILNVSYTYMLIYYKYKGLATDGVTDSIRTNGFRLTTAPDVIQMNRIVNTYPSSLLTAEGTGKTYIKAPAGLYTEIEIPIGKIMARRKEKGYTILNSASLSIKGNSEEESKMGLSKPSYILLVNKDSIDTFFGGKGSGKLNYTTNTIIQRTSSTNTYNLGNLGSLIDHYIRQKEDNNESFSESDVLKYSLIPVTVVATTTSLTSSGTYTTIPSTVAHQMSPTGAILRTDAENMVMALIQSKFKR